VSELHVHGVTSAGEREAIEAAGAHPVVHGDVAAVTTEAAAEGTRAAELMRRHWRVLEALAESVTVLPVRFGTAMRSDDAVVEQFLAPRHDDLAARLATFDGKVQMTVKGTYDEQALMRAIVESSPHVAHMRERVRAAPGAAGHFERVRLGELVAAEVQARRERDAAAVVERLEGLAVESRAEPAGGVDGAVNAAFLVERTRAAEFGEAADAIAAELAGRIEVRCLGPLPPFSFASEEAPAWA